jgi:hypothetical protein
MANTGWHRLPRGPSHTTRRTVTCSGASVGRVRAFRRQESAASSWGPARYKSQLEAGAPKALWNAVPLG